MKTKLLPADLFERILSKQKRNTGTDVEQVGLECEHNNYAISFYGNLEDDYLLRVEEFGFMCDGKWVQLSPTEEQKQAMQKVLDDEVKSVKDEVNWREPFIDDDFE